MTYIEPVLEDIAISLNGSKQENMERSVKSALQAPIKLSRSEWLPSTNSAVAEQTWQRILDLASLEEEGCQESSQQEEACPQESGQKGEQEEGGIQKEARFQEESGFEEKDSLEEEDGFKEEDGQQEASCLQEKGGQQEADGRQEEGSTEQAGHAQDPDSQVGCKAPGRRALGPDPWHSAVQAQAR